MIESQRCLRLGAKLCRRSNPARCRDAPESFQVCLKGEDVACVIDSFAAGQALAPPFRTQRRESLMQQKAQRAPSAAPAQRTSFPYQIHHFLFTFPYFICLSISSVPVQFFVCIPVVSEFLLIMTKTCLGVCVCVRVCADKVIASGRSSWSVACISWHFLMDDLGVS